MMIMPLPDFETLWDYEQPAKTERKFRDILPMAVIMGDVSYRIELMTQIARAQGLQRQFALAHATLDKASALLVESKQPLFIAQIRGLLERGRVHNTAGDKASARELFLKAWLTATSIGQDALAIDAAHMMGIVEPPEEQLAWTLKALDVAQQSTDLRAKRWLGSLYNNLGWTYHDLGRYDEALDMFERGLRFREREGQDKEARIARWTVGRTLRSLGRLDEALETQQMVLAELKAAGKTDGYVYEELGEILLAMGKPDEARPHFARAYELLSQDTWLAENEPARLARLKKHGKAKSKRKA